MSIKEIKEQLKTNVDRLSVTETRLAAKELGQYFDYLEARKEMPQKCKLRFEQYLVLVGSVKQAENGKLIPASKVFADIKKKYGFNS